MSAKQLAADLDKVAHQLPTAIEQAGQQAAQLLATTAQRRAPRRTGYLAGSITAAPGSVTVGAPYGAVINNGWPAHGIHANPFLTGAPAAVDWGAPYVEALTDALHHLNPTY